MRFTFPLVCVLLVPALSACPGPQPHEDDELCEHLADGPAEAVTAATSGDGPLIADDHTRYDITLAAVTGGNGGTVRFAADEAGEFIIALDAAVPLVVTDGSGATVTAEDTATSSEACTEIRGRHVFDLEVGTYVLRFGPTAETKVGVVVEHGAHDH